MRARHLSLLIYGHGFHDGLQKAPNYERQVAGGRVDHMALAPTDCRVNHKPRGIESISSPASAVPKIERFPQDAQSGQHVNPSTQD